MCLVVVGACWVPCWGLLAILFMISKMPVAGCGAAGIAIFGTVVACRLGARVLARTSMPWWPLVTAALGASSIAIAYCLQWSLGLLDHQLGGPISPSGLTATILVRDCGLGWSADFYTDVRVLDTHGNIVAEWKDLGGWDSRDGPRRMRDSMRWTSANTLEFQTGEGYPQQLTVR